MSKPYQIIARKYRPQLFAEVVGQQSIVQTLKNAIKMQKSAYAYLFAGSRGTGKTTLARIFAKALNCPNLTPNIEPCNQCTSCQEIASSRSLDVMEIDGASSRGIDDIRHINETIGYSPSSGKYKIILIDEVHMLTKEAFNALLKTLEEPPRTIKFFFATTEPHKVLPTILSRCQRFDLTKIPTISIKEKLQAIAKDLDREVEDNALHLIAQFSEGSLRDAESFLDQVLCYEEGNVSQESIIQILGTLPKQWFFSIDEAIQTKDIHQLFSLLDTLFNEGKNISHFYEELIEHFRYLLLTQLGIPTPELMDEFKEKYLKNIQYYSQRQLLYIIELLVKSHSSLLKSPFKRVTIEMLFMQILQSQSSIKLPELIQRLIDLEKKIALPTNPAPVASTANVQLVKVPFSLTPPKHTAEPILPPPVSDKPVATTDQTQKYDTLMNFAAVELEGSLKKIR